MIQRPKGTKDLLPQDTYKWQIVESKLKEVLDSYNFKEIRVPVFEHTELFQRGVGETTDVVQKEMYTFNDKGGRSITLRPEGTAGVVRAYLENGMASMPSPIKLWYNMGMYRYENVQKGRLREFHQIGAELIGSSSFLADVDVILMANDFFKKLNIPNIKLTINSIGCPKCRAVYQDKLREFFKDNLENYCDTCKTRYVKNPMRMLDCKEEKCKKMNVGAPKMIDFLCEECQEHFENVKKYINKAGIKYEIDPNIVRGLDYYTKTVFEFIDEKTGLTVLGGGRYDGLVEEFGGQPTPAVGFATGVERLMEMYEEYNSEVEDKVPDLYILSMGENANIEAMDIANKLRIDGFIVEKDIMDRSFKSQMKYANTTKSKKLIVIGDEELSMKTIKIKDMATGEEKEIGLNIDEIKSNL
jgi:histidyl-tRNA synthetase